MFSTVSQRIRTGAALTVLLCAPDAAAAADQPRVQLLDSAREQRIVIAIGPLQAQNADFQGTVRLPRGMMLHQVAVRILDGTGNEAGGAVEVSLAATGAYSGMRPLLRLAAGQLTLELPRPLGVRLDEGESVTVHGRLIGSTDAAFSVHIVLAYDHTDGPVSRLAVVPVQLRLGVEHDSTGGAAITNEWRATGDGRVMVLAGLPADVAGELSLIDVESGVTVWHDVLQTPTAEAFSVRSDVVRVGAPVRAGRTYRLVLRVHTPVVSAERLVHALVVPVHTTVATRS